MTAPAAFDVKRVLAYLSLFDFTRKPTTRSGWYVRVAATAFVVFLLCRRVVAETRPLLKAAPPPAIPTAFEDYRFGIPERTRRAIFAELAAIEQTRRRHDIATNAWNGHLWSREDDRGWQERTEARRLAAKYRVSLTQIYLVLDEGIHERWPGPDGEPLPATTPPLNPREGW